MIEDYEKQDEKKGDKKKVTKDYDSLLKDAVENVESWYTYYSKNISEFKESNKFLYEKDGQWRTKDIEEYDRRRKVRLTINQCHPLVKYLVGQFRENTPSLQVKPKGNSKVVPQKDVDIADQLLRTHMDRKEARIAFQTGYQQALTGYGAIEVSTEYESDESFYQTFKIKGIKNPLKAAFDPDAEHPCKIDGSFCSLYTKMTKKVFDRKYPGNDYVDFSKELSSGAGSFDWGDEKSVTILKYAYRKFIGKKEIVGLSNGDVVDAKKAEKHIKDVNELAKLNEQLTGMITSPIFESQRREVDDYEIYVCQMMKNKVLEEPKLWKSSMLPILYVDGESYVDLETDRQTIRPFIQDAKSLQESINFSYSENINAIKRAQYQKKMMTKAQVKGNEKYYTGTNSSELYIYNSVPGVEKPTDSPASQVNPVYMQTVQDSSQMLKFVTGMSQPMLGEHELERSGRALGHEIRQSATGNFTVIDNIYRVMECTANMLLELFPVVFDSTRDVMLTNTDGESSSVTLNAPAGFDKDGNQMYKNDMRSFKYTVSINPGAPSALQKKETLDALFKTMETNPAFASITPDLVAENIDIKNSPRLVKRAKSLLPPAIVAEESGKPMPPPQPTPEQAIEQQKQQNEQKKLMLEEKKIEQEGMVSGMRASTELKKSAMDFRSKQMDTASNMSKHKNDRLVEQNQRLKELLSHFATLLEGQGVGADV
jgi:hypothetical protein